MAPELQILTRRELRTAEPGAQREARAEEWKAQERIMICYKDRTWCLQKDCAKFETCPRALTDKEDEQAQKWWGGADYPVSAWVEQQECFEQKQV